MTLTQEAQLISKCVLLFTKAGPVGLSKGGKALLRTAV